MSSYPTSSFPLSSQATGSATAPRGPSPPVTMPATYDADTYRASDGRADEGHATEGDACDKNYIDSQEKKPKPMFGLSQDAAMALSRPIHGESAVTVSQPSSDAANVVKSTIAQQPGAQIDVGLRMLGAPGLAWQDQVEGDIENLPLT